MRKLWMVSLCLGIGIGILGSHSSSEAFPKPTLQRVEYMLKHVYWRVKWQGLCLLQQYYENKTEAIPWVASVLLPKDRKDIYATTWKLRQRAAQWLHATSHPKAWLALLQASERESQWQIRQQVASYLADIPVFQKRALLSLEDLQQDPHPQVRQTATSSLKKLQANLRQASKKKENKEETSPPLQVLP